MARSTRSRRKTAITTSARRATWIAFGLIALSAVARAADSHSSLEESDSQLHMNVGGSTAVDPPLDALGQAQRAYDQAFSLLSTLPPSASGLGITPSSAPAPPTDPSTPPDSFLGSLIAAATANQAGPVASALRILGRLRDAVGVAGPVGRLLGSGSSASSPGKSTGSGLGFGMGMGMGRKERELRSRAAKVVELLQFASDAGHEDALYLYAKISLLPPFPLPQNASLSYSLFSAHASLTGNASSQSYLAFLLSTGYKSAIPPDPARALLHWTFATEGDGSGGNADGGAEMALGYRYMAGIGVNDDCGRALELYESVAERAMAKFLNAPPGGRTLPLAAAKLSDLAGGAYGPGSSVASTGINAHRTVIKAASALAAGETWDDVLEYYLWHADRGQIEFAFKLGKIFYQGSLYASPGGIASGGEGVSAIPRDFPRARAYFLRIARLLYPKDSTTAPTAHKNPTYFTQATNSVTAAGAEDGVVGYTAAASAYLGRMYLRGEGVKRDWELARMWFERGAEFGERECQNGLGLMWRDGLIGAGGIGGKGKVDLQKAFDYFTVAAGQELAEAQVNLGKHHYYRKEFPLAITYFETAIRHGSPFEAYYYLASIQAHQYHTLLTTSTLPSAAPAARAQAQTLAASSCAVATSFYKFVAERGTWSGGAWEADLMVEAEEAWHDPGAGWRGKEEAMLKWWMAAERGVEGAQNNIAFVLDQHRALWGSGMSPYEALSPVNDTARLALTQWTRSAGQRNIDAIVKVADYYYHGIGLPSIDAPAATGTGPTHSQPDTGPPSESKSESESESSRNLGQKTGRIEVRNPAQESREAELREREKERRLERAAGYYQVAVDTQLSALAMWNLGWMYENGVGVPQDFHLAKRHYDLALETNSEAYLPVLFALVKLHARSFWHTLMGGEGGLALWGGADEEYDEVEPQTQAPQREGLPAAQDDGEETERRWYMGSGKAKEDRNRRSRNQNQNQNPAQRADNDDPVQWARDHRREMERDEESEWGLGPDDYFDGAARHRERDGEGEDDFGETMLLVGLCLMVSFLVYMRGRWIERRRQEEQRRQNGQGPAAPQPPGQGGLFDRDDWRVLR